MTDTAEITQNQLQINILKLISEDDDPTNDSQSLSESHHSHTPKDKYKTEKCRYWLSTRCCPFGKNCVFAHGQLQKREKNTPVNYKTKHCRNFSKFGVCKYGERCQFIHEVRSISIGQHQPNFSQYLDSLASVVERNLFPEQYLESYKRLKFFESFSEDSFQKINWVYKKPRMYTM